MDREHLSDLLPGKVKDYTRRDSWAALALGLAAVLLSPAGGPLAEIVCRQPVPKSSRELVRAADALLALWQRDANAAYRRHVALERIALASNPAARVALCEAALLAIEQLLTRKAV